MVSRSSGNYVRCIFHKLVKIYTLHFSSFQFDWKNSTEVTGRRGEQGHYSTTKMGNTAMVYNVIKYGNRNSSSSSYNSKCTSVSSQQLTSPSQQEENVSIRLRSVRNKLKSRTFSEKSVKFIKNSWRPSTNRKYNLIWAKWNF